MTGADGATDDGRGAVDEPDGDPAAAVGDRAHDESGHADAAVPVDDWPDELPRWEDDYLNRVALRLARHYDLKREYAVDGEQFPLYGQLRIRHERHVVHPSITFAEHDAEEHVFVREIGRPTVADVEELAALGDRLADEWVEADEDHYSTDFTFVVVADALPDDVADFVGGYSNRNLLKFGYYGHTEVNLVAVAPDAEASAASAAADVEGAFRVWEPVDPDEPGRLGRFLNWLSR